MAVVLGMDCVLYYGTAGSTADTEADNIKDVTLTLEKGEADATTRGNDGWRATVGTLKDGSVSFDIVWDSSDAFFTALQEAWFDGDAIALLILSGAVAVSGVEGLDADYAIINFTRNESLEEVVTVSVTAKPTYSTRAPSWYTVS